MSNILKLAKFLKWTRGRVVIRGILDGDRVITGRGVFPAKFMTGVQAVDGEEVIGYIDGLFFNVIGG